ncbi:metallophosphoesterase [Myxococcota bacterium]
MTLTRHRPSVLAALLLLGVLGCTPKPIPPPAITLESGRIVAVGDVHGNFEGLSQILQRAQIINADLKWIGGRTVLVQTGDLLDRGGAVRQVLDLLMDLQKQAASAGGRVIVLMGNHEVMNLTGEFDLVSTEAYASFPGGAMEYRKALGPEGRYGKWLLSLPVIVRVHDTLFMHAGISPEYTEWGLDDINQQVQEALEQQDSGAEGILFNRQGPLWFRGLARWEEERLAGYLNNWLLAQGARRIVAAHTPRETGEIQMRLAGRIFLIDTGMLASEYPGGRASALEIDAGIVSAVYPDGKQLLFKPESGDWLFMGPDGKPLPFSSHQQVLDFLRTARVVSSKEFKDGVNTNKKLMLEKDGVRARAILRLEHVIKDAPLKIGRRNMHFRDSYTGEIAAYQLNRMLGMDNLPPVVKRNVEGYPGSLQLWVEESISEYQRKTSGRQPPDMDEFDRQVNDMRVFDNLINNTDRHAKNRLIDKRWKLWLIDHTRTFGKDKYLPLPYSMKSCSPKLRRALELLDEKQVRARLKHYLSGDELDALFVRLRLLLEFLERRRKAA